MHIENEPIVASSPLGRVDDKKNQCFISKEKLIIRRNSRVTKFELADISPLFIENKILLIPLVLGGITAPLAVLALLKTTGNPWILLSLLIGGLALLYYGYEGSPSLTVRTKVKDFHHFITSPTPNLKAFITYANEIIAFGMEGISFYLSLSNEEWMLAQRVGQIEVGSNYPLCYRSEINILGHSELIVVSFDPTKSDGVFQFISKDGAMRPYLMKNLKLEDIKKY